CDRPERAEIWKQGRPRCDGRWCASGFSHRGSSLQWHFDPRAACHICERKWPAAWYRAGSLPCIWKENCSNQFMSVDAKGTVAGCVCWVTSYPEYFFGNMSREPDLTSMLKTSRARRDFVERPKRLVEDEDCLSCRYLSICHGGCPGRTYSALGTMMDNDPYCEVYKAVVACAEAHAGDILRARAAPIISLRERHKAVGSSGIN